MYPSSSLLGDNKDDHNPDMPPVDELIENADGFAGVFPGTLINMSYLISQQISFRKLLIICLNNKLGEKIKERKEGKGRGGVRREYTLLV